MTPAARFLIRQATKGIDGMSTAEKKLLWQGLAELLPEDSEAGLLARHNLMAIQAAEAAQASFLEELNEL